MFQTLADYIENPLEWVCGTISWEVKPRKQKLLKKIRHKAFCGVKRSVGQ